MITFQMLILTNLTINQMKICFEYVFVPFLLKRPITPPYLVFPLKVAFPCLRILGETSTIHSHTCALKKYFEVEISPHTLIPLLRPGSFHSGSVS